MKNIEEKIIIVSWDRGRSSCREGESVSMRGERGRSWREGVNNLGHIKENKDIFRGVCRGGNIGGLRI